MVVLAISIISLRYQEKYLKKKPKSKRNLIDIIKNNIKAPFHALNFKN